MSVDIDLEGQARPRGRRLRRHRPQHRARRRRRRGRDHRGRPQPREARRGRRHCRNRHRDLRRRHPARALPRAGRRGDRRHGWHRRGGLLDRGLTVGAARGDRRPDLAERDRHQRHRTRARRPGRGRPRERRRRDRLPLVDLDRRGVRRARGLPGQQGGPRPDRAVLAIGATRPPVRVHGGRRHHGHRVRPRLRPREGGGAVPEVAGVERDLREPHAGRRPRCHHRRVRGDAARAPRSHHPRAHDRAEGRDDDRRRRSSSWPRWRSTRDSSAAPNAPSAWCAGGWRTSPRLRAGSPCRCPCRGAGTGSRAGWPAPGTSRAPPTACGPSP